MDWKQIRKFYRIRRTDGSRADIYQAMSGFSILIGDNSVHYMPVAMAEWLREKHITEHDKDDFSKIEKQYLFSVEELTPGNAEPLVAPEEWKVYEAHLKSKNLPDEIKELKTHDKGTMTKDEKLVKELRGEI